MSRRGAIVVTLADLCAFAAHAEKTAMYSSSYALYAHRLSDLEEASVIVVNRNGEVHDEVDRRQMTRIYAGMQRLDQRLRRRCKARRTGVDVVA